MRRCLIRRVMETCALVVMFIAAPALACAPFVVHISDFLRHPSGVAFAGSVVSLQERIGHDGTVEQVAGIYVRKWYTKGRADSIVHVVGGRRWAPDQLDCGGFEFLMKTGQEWLIVGRVSDGRIFPEGSLSREVSDTENADELFLNLPDHDPEELARRKRVARLDDILRSHFRGPDGEAADIDWQVLDHEGTTGSDSVDEYIWLEFYSQDVCTQHGLARMELVDGKQSVRLFMSAPVIRLQAMHLSGVLPDTVLHRVVELSRLDCRDP